MSKGDQARATIEIRSGIEPTVSQMGFARVKRHSNPEFETRRPWLTTQRELGIPRCTRSIGSSREHANDDAMRVVIRCSRPVVRDGGSREDLLVATQRIRGDRTRHLARSRRVGDVGDQERHSPRRQGIGPQAAGIAGVRSDGFHHG